MLLRLNVFDLYEVFGSSDLSEKWSEHSRQYCGMLMVMGLCRIVPRMTALKGCAVGVRC